MPFINTSFFVLRFFSSKFADRFNGQRNTLAVLRTLTPAGPNARLWFHAASMGEFEQTKSVIEHIKAQEPATQIVVSFYSPSGYNSQAHYRLADAVVYMHPDTRKKARAFLAACAPDAAVFVRYDVWHNHLRELRLRGIPAVLICATLNEHSLRFRSLLLHFSRAMYAGFSAIYTAGESETMKFRTLGIGGALHTGADTRFDRIAAVVAEARTRPLLPPGLFQSEHLVLVVGSSWMAEEEHLAKALRALDAAERKRIRLIIAPHEPTPEHVQRLGELFGDALLLSRLESLLGGTATGAEAIPTDWRAKTIIVDGIGKLLRLYGAAHCAIIGGGHGAGVHSVSEPAGYGIPLASGPDIHNARDAVALHAAGALTVLHDTADYTAWLKLMLSDEQERRRRGTIAGSYVAERTGFSAGIATAVLDASRHYRKNRSGE